MTQNFHRVLALDNAPAIHWFCTFCRRTFMRNDNGHCMYINAPPHEKMDGCCRECRDKQFTVFLQIQAEQNAMRRAA